MRIHILLPAAAIVLASVGGAYILGSRQNQQAPAASVSAPAGPVDAGVLPSPASPNVVLPHASLHKVDLTYYVTRETADDMELVPHVTSISVAGTPSMWRQAHKALQAMEQFPRADGAERNPLPSGARILGVRINEGQATVNVSQSFVDNFNGGAREEQMTVYAIVNTVAGVPGVDAVSFEVNGKPLSQLGGHVDLSEPLTPDASLVGRAR
ncbi:MAG TPA: GerMN domain-containing protein [Armatimonadota bacterium]|jgi:spore germination protein GerM